MQDGHGSEPNFREVVGDSPALRQVLTGALNAARTEATLLFAGETGTGKELIASIIHCLSRRKNHSFVKVDCAGASSEQLQAELFGNPEKTGGSRASPGAIERANQGIL